MFLRLLVWLALLAAVWMAWRPRRRGASRRPVAPPEAMAGCARCGVHLPASEAVRDAAGRAYCDAAHRAAGPRGAR